ncbi:MAG: LD-carboxypeptidase [Clostridia bacterium]|nr:LD-carboxypeptidase [Clostridia bacterium]
MLKPRALRPGDTIGMVGVSGALPEFEARFPRTIEAIEALGFKVIVADSCRERYGYLSGTDARRAEGLNRMFADDRVDAVVCMRGGYGVTRMLDQVDFDVIRANPKILLGYSDITALHNAIQRRVGMVTFHGPMPSTCWTHLDDFSRDSMLRTLTCTKPLGLIENPAGMAPRCVVPGRCEGRLAGGNLSLIAATCGTPYQLNARGRVLVIEDIDEYVYRLDSMLTQLRLAGMFEQCAGVVLGGFTNCRQKNPELDFTIEDVVRDIIAPFGKPVLANMAIGHLETKLTLPLGVRCILDATEGRLEIVESALKR